MKQNDQKKRHPTSLTSALDPRLGANGKVTKEGTKNTGSHLANTSLPGDNKPYTPSPSSALTLYKANKVMNITPHPPNDDGKDVMFKALNSFLKKTSSRMKENVDAMEVKMDGFEGDLPIGNDEESAVVDDILSDDDDEME